MPSKSTPAALAKVLKLLDASGYYRIELALTLAKQEYAKPGTAADHAKSGRRIEGWLYHPLEGGNRL